MDHSPSTSSSRKLIIPINPPNANPLNVPIDYLQTRINAEMSSFLGVRFIFECGAKLNVGPMTISTASILFHRFNAASTDESYYDIYLICGACLNLAGKMESEKVRLRDIVNVARTTLHREILLDMGREYEALLESLVSAELLIMRILKFDATVTHPQKYLVHYLKSMEKWSGVHDWRKSPIGRSAWAFLQDFLHDRSFINYPPQSIAISAIDMALFTYGFNLPLISPDPSKDIWQKIFYPEFDRATHDSIILKILNVYELENNIIRQTLFKKSNS